MRSQINGTDRGFNPNCHEITVFCKRIDRALDRLSRNNTLVFTAGKSDMTNVVIVRYSLPLIQRVKHLDDKGHKSRVTGIGDGRYMPISYGTVGSRGSSGVCWSADIRFFQGCITTIEYSDKYLCSYPRFEQYPLLDFKTDHCVDTAIADNIILRNVGIFLDTLHPSVHTAIQLQYHEDIDSFPQLLVNPKASASRTAQILKDHFNIIVGVDQASAVLKQLPNT